MVKVPIFILVLKSMLYCAHMHLAKKKKKQRIKQLFYLHDKSFISFVLNKQLSNQSKILYSNV